MIQLVDRRPRRSIVAAGAAALGLSLAVAGGVALAADESVQIVDFAFAPATVTITAGDRVTWTNVDPVAHTATATDGSWDTGDIGQDASASITFSTPGTYAYLCTPHPTMTGTVVVQAAAGGGGGGGGNPTIPPTDAVGHADVTVPTSTSPAAGLAVAGLAGVLGVLFIVARRRPPTAEL